MQNLFFDPFLQKIRCYPLSKIQKFDEILFFFNPSKKDVARYLRLLVEQTSLFFESIFLIQSKQER